MHEYIDALPSAPSLGEDCGCNKKHQQRVRISFSLTTDKTMEGALEEVKQLITYLKGTSFTDSNFTVNQW